MVRVQFCNQDILKTIIARSLKVCELGRLNSKQVALLHNSVLINVITVFLVCFFFFSISVTYLRIKQGYAIAWICNYNIF